MLPRWLSSKESICQCRRSRRCRFYLWVGRSPGEGNDNLLKYSYLENPMGSGAWQAAVDGVTKSWTQLSDWIHAWDKYILTLWVLYRQTHWWSKMRREKYFKVKNSIESVMPQVTTTTTKNLLQAYRNN